MGRYADIKDNYANLNKALDFKKICTFKGNTPLIHHFMGSLKIVIGIVWYNRQSLFLYGFYFPFSWNNVIYEGR